MRKVLLVLVIATLTLSVAKAQKCKPVFSSVDEFTEQKIEAWGGKMATKDDLLRGTNQTLKVFVYKMDGKQYIDLHIQFMQKGYDASVNTIDIPKGSKFMLKTENGIISFIATVSTKKKRKYSKYFYTTVILTAEISDDQTKKLCDNLITMYKVEPLETEVVKGKVKPSKAKKLEAQFNCFYKSLTSEE